eukprot:scaffold55568_cov21-Prasinocladus_malaysianus.AAC.1
MGALTGADAAYCFLSRLRLSLVFVGAMPSSTCRAARFEWPVIYANNNNGSDCMHAEVRPCTLSRFARQLQRHDCQR